jgi:hypothetical protein
MVGSCLGALRPPQQRSGHAQGASFPLPAGAFSSHSRKEIRTLHAPGKSRARTSGGSHPRRSQLRRPYSFGSNLPTRFARSQTSIVFASRHCRAWRIASCSSVHSTICGRPGDMTRQVQNINVVSRHDPHAPVESPSFPAPEFEGIHKG